MKRFDITDEINQSQLDYLDCVETTGGFRSGDYFMAETIAMSGMHGNRCIDPEDYEIELLELHMGNQMVHVSKWDVELLAKHFKLIPND